VALSDRWRAAAYVITVAAFLWIIGGFYRPGFGMTAFLEFPGTSHDWELPAVAATPHVHHPGSGGYDGQFYGTIALDPFLADPALDRALDDPPYRTRRILAPWLAYAAGFGRPAWVLNLYAIENVVAWMGLSWILLRWIRPDGWRAFVLWAGSLWAHGLTMSVRYALPDGVSVVMLALGVAAVEAGRPWVAALWYGPAILARETSVLGLVALAARLRRTRRSWLVAAAVVLVSLVPLALWLDYLRSIYRGDVAAGGHHLVRPLEGALWKARSILTAVTNIGLTWEVRDKVLALAAFAAQAAWLLWRLVVRRDASPWVLVGLTTFLFTLTLHRVVWDGTPGAYTRVAYPMTLAANITLARDRAAPWWVIVLVNLGVVPGAGAFRQ
jgi:hypothetical protein